MNHLEGSDGLAELKPVECMLAGERQHRPRGADQPPAQGTSAGVTFRSSETAKAWITQLRASGPPPSPNLGVVMGPDFAQLSANLGRNLLESRVGIFTAVFEAA